MLWTFAIVAALERVSVAARWLARSFRVSRSSDDSSVDDDDDDADDDRARLVGPPGSEYQQHPGHAPPPVRRALPLQLPYVCVQLPMYDEAKVARRIIDSACLLRWPRDLLEIQILDDSDDERCRAIVDASAARWRERGLMCNVVRRSHRRGFKAGALEAGRKKTAADLVAVFDADCVPFPDYLERVVPHFYEPDGVTMVPNLAMVQARWGFLNHDDNVVTRAQAMGLEAHRAAAARRCRGRRGAASAPALGRRGARAPSPPPAGGTRPPSWRAPTWRCGRTARGTSRGFSTASSS